ncbi:hypothetical protein TNCV_2777551 [Trichonephila clavipes]|nr:hypothetical protein TNCV_2777551 [Trichonephila clavipes]
MRAFGDSPRNFEIWSRTTPELELSCPNYHTNGRTFKLDRFNVHRTPTRYDCNDDYDTAVLSGTQDSPAFVSPRTITWHLDEGHLVSRCPLRVLTMTPYEASIWSGVEHDWIGLQRNGTKTS